MKKLEKLTKTVRLSQYYAMFDRLVGEDIASDWAILRADDCRLFEVDYRMKNGNFQMIGDYEMNLSEFYRMHEAERQVAFGDTVYNFEPHILGRIFATCLDWYEVDYRYRVVDDQLVVIEIE